MVDTLDLGSSAFGRAGSSPASRTALAEARRLMRSVEKKIGAYVG